MHEHPLREIAFSEYPITLQNMPHPPQKLWIRGSWPDFNTHKFLCVIGSRTPSPYGIQAVKKLIAGLRGYPISIVSGLAIGIDSLAHEAALEAGLHCCGFPGSGLDWSVMYPRSRVDLGKRIAASGSALFSEWVPTFPFTNWTFAKRNETMAGLAQATLIIEAKQGSGTLMTAEYAEKYNRDVLVVPGSIFSDLSYGPHMLFKRGAIPIFESRDILEALGFAVPENGEVSEERLGTLDSLSRQIIERLRSQEISPDTLATELALGPAELNAKISFLELEGLVQISDGLLRLA